MWVPVTQVTTTRSLEKFFLTGSKVFAVPLRKSILASRKGEIEKMHTRSVASYRGQAV